MAALSFHSNWPTAPTFHQQHHHNTAIVPPSPPPDFLPFHDNYHDHLSTNFNNNATFTSNNLSFHNSTDFPTLSSSFYDNDHVFSPLTNVGQECYSNPIFVPNVFDHQEYFLPINPMMEYQTQPQYNPYPSFPSYESYPFVHDQDLCPAMDQIMQPELPTFPEIYDLGNVCNNDVQLIKEDANGNGNRGGRGKERISAQSMAARVRRRKISEKTLELGKLVPGGHKMTTAEMFQAAYKYIKFLQAQVGVLQLMSSSPELGEELQAFVTSPAVQEKLYAEGKCIVSQALAKTIADDDDQEI